MEWWEYKDLPAFKYGHIIENHIQSIEFDNNLLTINDTEDDGGQELHVPEDFDPIYNRFFSSELPTLPDFESFHAIANEKLAAPSTLNLPKPVLSQSDPTLITSTQKTQQIKEFSVSSRTPNKPTIKDFFKSQTPIKRELPKPEPAIPDIKPQEVVMPKPEQQEPVKKAPNFVFKQVKRDPIVLPKPVMPNEPVATTSEHERDWFSTSPKPVTRDIPKVESPKQFGGRGRREPKPGEPTGFLTAKDQLIADVKKDCRTESDFKSTIRHLGLAKPPAATSKFQSPLVTDEVTEQQKKPTTTDSVDERLKGIDEKLLERIKNDVIESPSSMSWKDVKGLEFAKRVIQESIIYPILRPEIFTGLRRPPKGVLLFGPPGNGKTLIAKCIASTASAMFFNISASSLTSKWIGEGEMLVRALFTYARINQPAVVFIDEVDSLLSRRSENEHESSRRLKTEFLVFLDGAGTGEDERILIIGATNRPQELDEAVRRRFTKRLYIPLPNKEARKDIIVHHLKLIDHNLNDEEIDQLASDTNGYSGADIKSLSQEAAMIPMRELMETVGFDALNTMTKDDIPAVGYRHFIKALEQTKPSVSEDDINEYIDWNKKYGSG